MFCLFIEYVGWVGMFFLYAPYLHIVLNGAQHNPFLRYSTEFTWIEPYSVHIVTLRYDDNAAFWLIPIYRIINITGYFFLIVL